MSYNISHDHDLIKMKSKVPFYTNHLEFKQAIMVSPFVIILNVISIACFITFIIAPLVHVSEGSPLWSLLFMLFIIPSLVYPILSLFYAAQPEIKSGGYYQTSDLDTLKVNRYLSLPKETRKKLKPLAKYANKNRDDLSEWQDIVDQYYDLNKTGVLDSKNKVLLDSIKADLEAQKQTQKIMREQGWLK